MDRVAWEGLYLFTGKIAAEQFVSLSSAETDSSESVPKEMPVVTSEPDVASVTVAHSADLHGALTGIVSPAQLQAATAGRKHSEAMAAYEIGDWTERAAAASAQLVGFSRITSQRRVEMMDQVLTALFVQGPYRSWKVTEFKIQIF